MVDSDGGRVEVGMRIGEEKGGKRREAIVGRAERIVVGEGQGAEGGSDGGRGER